MQQPTKVLREGHSVLTSRRMYSAITSPEEVAHQEMGVAAISKRLHEGVTQYHAQIGASVPMAYRPLSHRPHPNDRR